MRESYDVDGLHKASCSMEDSRTAGNGVWSAHGGFVSSSSTPITLKHRRHREEEEEEEEEEEVVVSLFA